MSAMAVLIASACIGSSGVRQEACEKGLEAGTKQLGIERSISTLEYKAQKGANTKAVDWFGQTGSEFVGGTLFLVKAISDKSVSLKLPTFGLADRVTTIASANAYRLNLEWRF